MSKTIEANARHARHAEHLSATDPRLIVMWRTAFERLENDASGNMLDQMLYGVAFGFICRDAWGVDPIELRVLSQMDPTGIEQVGPTDPRVAELWAQAGSIADSLQMCNKFDQITLAIADLYRQSTPPPYLSSH